MTNYRSCSFWLDTVPGPLDPRPPLSSDLDVDVAVVGGGYTGLWAAYYLSVLDPGLRIALLEKEICGYGASGRNGGWCSALFAGSRERTARRHGREAAVHMQKEMFATVDEVVRVATAEGIDCHFSKGGTLTLAITQAQLQRLQEELEHERAWGFGEDDYVWLDAGEARERMVVEGVLGAIYTPHCAAIHPARLVRGLADTVSERGVKIFEATEALGFEPRAVVTARGRVKAEIVVRATEGYTARLPGLRRALVPLYSLMIATEPLPEQVWDEIGWRERETMTDGRNLLIYLQRTADGRIAMGGRGAPYHYGSRVDDSFDREPQVFDELKRTLDALYPAAAGARITHRWGGPLGIPRDYYSSVGFDRDAGTAWAGGYVGDGVSTANLAGRTIADLVLERDTDITRLPWVGHRSPRWEPEPLRWIGLNLGLRLAAMADRKENRTGRPSWQTTAVAKLRGY